MHPETYIIQIGNKTFSLPWNLYLLFLEEMADENNEQVIESRLIEMLRENPYNSSYCEDKV